MGQKRKPLALGPFVFLAVAASSCSPSPSALQTAIQGTMASWTQQPSQIPLPTHTPAPTVAIEVTRVVVVTPTPASPLEMFDAACGKGYSPVSADLYGFEAPGDAQGNWLPTGLTSEVLPFIEGCVASVEPYDSATGANASMLVQFYDIHDGRFYAFPFQVGIDGLVGYLFGNTHTIITVGEAWAAFTPLVSSQGSCRQVEIQLEATDAAGQASTVRALLDALRVGYDLGSIPSGTTYVTSNFSYYDDTPSNGCY